MYDFSIFSTYVIDTLLFVFPLGQATRYPWFGFGLLFFSFVFSSENTLGKFLFPLRIYPYLSAPCIAKIYKLGILSLNFFHSSCVMLIDTYSSPTIDLDSLTLLII